MHHVNTYPTSGTTIADGHPYPLTEQPLHTTAFHGTSEQHRPGIVADGLTRPGDGPYGPAVYLTVHRAAATIWAYSTVARDDHHTARTGVRPLHRGPVVVTCTVDAARTVTVGGWDWHLPHALAAHLGRPSRTAPTSTRPSPRSPARSATPESRRSSSTAPATRTPAT